MLSGPAGYQRRNGGIAPFKALKKEELLRVCHWRRLPAGDLKKPELELQLKEHMRGISRVPALLCHQQNVSPDQCNLGTYEVLATESLHDLKNHIKHIWDELPLNNRLNREELSLFLEVTEALLTYKDKLRGLDYRLSTIIMYKHLESVCRAQIHKLLQSLAELGELLYLQEHKRCPRIVLRLHNVAFRHALLCKQVIGTPKTMTLSKFYGIYWHAIVVHAPVTFRVVSLSVEEQ